MTQRPLFKLSPRLMKCAQSVRLGKKIADVGTDHAYLPIWLAKKNLITAAIAADINEGPLILANKNIIKYHVEDIVRTVQSDGLQNINSEDADDIIIAGMGGDIIVKILENVDWIRNNNKRLILQPMSGDEKLRFFLFENKFKIVKEETVISQGRVYTVMSCEWTGEEFLYDPSLLYLGKILETSCEANKIYLEKVIRHLKNKSHSEVHKQNSLEIISKLKEALKNDNR